MGQGSSLFECMSDREDRQKDFISFNSEKKNSGPTVQLINGVRHLSSPWPVSTDSSLYFSPSPVKFDEDKYIISPFDIMSPSQSRENEMTVAKSKELSSLVQAGNIDGLTMAVVKWHLQYKDIRVENTPLLHLAVMADNFQMVKFLLSKGVDLNLLDQAGMSAFDYAATCKDLSIYPYLKTAIANDQVAIKLMIKPTELSQEIGDGSSSESISVDQTSYLSSMEVKNLHTRKENKMIMKKAYRESDFAYQRNQDGEESVDDDNSPRKEKRVAYTYKLVNDQVLSPLSQSSTGTSYSSIDQSDDILSGKQQKDVIPDEEGKQDEITHDGRVSESVNLIICNQSTPEESILIDETFQPVVAFSECRSPKILDRSLSSSSFITAKSTAKSPFKNMKKAAGRAFSFVAGGRAKKERKSMGVSSSQRHVQLK